MKIITLEEHFQLAEIKKAVSKMLPGFANGFHLPAYDAPDSQLEDLGADRLHHMDAMGIDVQVLSYPSSGIQVVPAAEAVQLAREANDQLATACRRLLSSAGVCDTQRNVYPATVLAHPADHGGRSHHVRG